MYPGYGIERHTTPESEVAAFQDIMHFGVTRIYAAGCTSRKSNREGNAEMKGARGNYQFNPISLLAPSPSVTPQCNEEEAEVQADREGGK